MPLSHLATFVFTLHSGVAGRLTHGRVERDGQHVIVYQGGRKNEYISGTRLRSWCVLGPDGSPVREWCHVLPEDRHLLGSTRA